MKPRTKLQFRVVDLAKNIKPLTEIQKKWAYDECLEHIGYANKSRVICMDCGNTFSLSLVSRKKAVCPHCNTKLSIEITQKRTYEQRNYFAKTEIIEDFQVVRNFELFSYHKKDKPVKYFLHEILQYWIQPDLKVTLFGKSHNTQAFCDSWSGLMEIRTENTRSWYGPKYDVYARKYHPDSEIKPEYKKYGIDYNLRGLTFLEAIQKIPKDSNLETLIKAKYYNLLGIEGYMIRKYWPSLKICLRNNYKIKDASIYFDYLDLLSYFKKDLHNSKFVCPKNLKIQHDRLVKKKKEILRQQQIERNRLEAEKRQQNLEKAIIEYVDRNQKFFDLEIKKENISISILKSVQEFEEEGKELNHCVFVNEYYLKENSLILSAKVDGKRTETIELKLPEFKISQCRGLNNNPSDYNKKIVQLVKNNISKIRQLA